MIQDQNGGFLKTGVPWCTPSSHPFYNRIFPEKNHPAIKGILIPVHRLRRFGPEFHGATELLDGYGPGETETSQKNVAKEESR